MTKFVDSLGLKRLVTKIAEAVSNGTWLPVKKGEGEDSVVMGNGTATGIGSHAEGGNTKAKGFCSHAEGYGTTASGESSHAQGSYNYDDPSFIDMVGVGDDRDTTKNASAIYVKRDSDGYIDQSDPKKWLSVSPWCWWISRPGYCRGHEECARSDNRP